MFKKTMALLICLLFIISLVSSCAAPGNKTEAPKATEAEKPAETEKAAQPTATEAPKTIKIAYLSALLTHNYFATLYKGMKDRCAELGNIELVAHEANLDSTAQLNALETYIQAGFDGVIISPVDGTVLEPAVAKAKEKGMFVIGQAQPIPGASTNVVVKEYDYGFAGGVLAGQWIVDKLNGEAEVGILTTGNAKELVERARGIQEGILSIAPKAKIVSIQPGNTSELAVKATETILQAHPNVKVIQSVNDAGALGACEVFAAAGKAGPDIYIGGLDAAEEAKAKMKEPDSIFRATVDIKPYDNGKQCIDLLIEMIKTKTVAQAEVFISMGPLYQKDLK